MPYTLRPVAGDVPVIRMEQLSIVMSPTIEMPAIETLLVCVVPTILKFWILLTVLTGAVTTAPLDVNKAGWMTGSPKTVPDDALLTMPTRATPLTIVIVSM